MKIPLSVIKMTMLQNFYTPIQIYRTTPLRLQSLSSKQLCKKSYGFKNCGPKVFLSRRSFLSKSFWNNCNTVVLTGLMMKPPKEIKYFLVECNYFLKSQRKLKVVQL